MGRIVVGKGRSITSKAILGTMSVKDLRKIIHEKGLTDKDCIDKDSLMERAAEALMINTSEKKAGVGEQPIETAVDVDVVKEEVITVSSSSSSSIAQSQQEKDDEMKKKIRQLIISDPSFLKLFSNPALAPMLQKIAQNPFSQVSHIYSNLHPFISSPFHFFLTFTFIFLML